MMDKAPGRIQINAGIYKGSILFVPNAVVRPTPLMVRQALFNALMPTLSEGPFLDLFCGSGAMGLEALSRGAPAAVLVESGRAELAALKKSLAKMGLLQNPALALWPLDIERAVKMLGGSGQKFRYIFADPPYKLWERAANMAWPAALFSLLMPKGRIICQRGKNQPSFNLPQMVLYESRVYGNNALDFYKILGEEP